jgi:hypothetical protein
MTVPAVDTGGITQAQIFVGRKSLVVDVYGMKTSAQFVNTLLDNIRKRGAMDMLISDHAALEVSQRVLDVLRYYIIDNWQSEPHQQRQNFAERRWRDIKRLTYWLMGYCLVLAFFIYIYGVVDLDFILSYLTTTWQSTNCYS